MTAKLIFKDGSRKTCWYYDKSEAIEAPPNSEKLNFIQSNLGKFMTQLTNI